MISREKNRDGDGLLGIENKGRRWVVTYRTDRDNSSHGYTLPSRRKNRCVEDYGGSTEFCEPSSKVRGAPWNFDE